MAQLSGLFEDDIEFDIYKAIQTVGSVKDVYRIVIARENLRAEVAELEERATSLAPTEPPESSGVFLVVGARPDSVDDMAGAMLEPTVLVELPYSTVRGGETIPANYSSETTAAPRKVG